MESLQISIFEILIFPRTIFNTGAYSYLAKNWPKIVILSYIGSIRLLFW